MKRKITGILKRGDIFGHPVTLNLDRKNYTEYTHTTKLGGLITILAKFMVGIYSIVLFQKMFHYQGDKINEEIYALDLPNMEHMSYKNSRFLVMHTIRK